MKISVCIATYNGARYIEEQILSVLNQLDENDEIIVSDDNSTDNTVKLIEQIKDKRIKIYFNEINQNNTIKPIYKATKNFENSLIQAEGDIIFLCDQDDIWEPNKVAYSLNILENAKSILLVHNAIIFDEIKGEKENTYFTTVKSGDGVFKNIFRNTYLGCCMVFKKELLQYAIPFPKNLHAHDMWLGIIAEIYGSSVFIDKTLIKYRRHSSNVTMSSGRSKNSLFFKIKFRVKFLFQLIITLFKRRFLKNIND